MELIDGKNTTESVSISRSCICDWLADLGDDITHICLPRTQKSLCDDSIPQLVQNAADFAQLGIVSIICVLVPPTGGESLLPNLRNVHVGLCCCQENCRGLSPKPKVAF